jgi:hypothetical protein
MFRPSCCSWYVRRKPNPSTRGFYCTTSLPLTSPCKSEPRDMRIEDSSIPAAHARSKLVLVTFRPIEQSKRDVFITVIKKILTIFFGPSEKCKALYSTNCILVSIVNYIFPLLNVLNWARTGSFTQSLFAADLSYMGPGS